MTITSEFRNDSGFISKVELTNSLRIVREIGAASTVLLKNKNETLPLQKPRRIALIGMHRSEHPFLAVLH